MPNQFIAPFISQVASRDELRPALNYIAMRDGYIFATDGHIMCKIVVKALPNIASVPGMVEALEGKCFHWKEWKKIEGKAVLSFNDNGSSLTFTVKGRKNNEITVLYRNYKDNKFGLTPIGGVSHSACTPNYEAVIPHDITTRESVPVTIGFNPEFAGKLFKTMKSCHPSDLHGVRLNTSSPTRAASIEPDYESDSISWRDIGHVLMIIPTMTKL